MTLPTNRSMPVAPVIPELAYPNVREAVAWLCDAFGFVERWTAGDHRAQLAVGDAAVVVRAGGTGVPSDQFSVMVRVADVDAHHAHAVARGARVTSPPEDFPYGERQYNADDLAGHHWTFTQSIADVAPESWGGASGPGVSQRG